MSDLKSIIIQEIRDLGPMPVDRYMELCLSHSTHGYYMKKDPFGINGDFTTAPEISQIFGEMIGVWLINKWQELGSPANFALVELGPGRGTLMADILRTLKIAPALKPNVHLVEISPFLSELQKIKLSHYESIKWHQTIPKLNVPAIIIANEFFDALPIKQFINDEERCIVCDNNNLAFNMPAEDGITTEICASGLEIMTKITNQFSAGIIIDYGYIKTQKTNTLQAVRNHKYANILCNPGDNDITAHANFSALATASNKKITITTQRDFLLRHGADVRSKILKKETDLQRLIGPQQLGELFKVLCF